jgi:hypothetical protein
MPLLLLRPDSKSLTILDKKIFEKLLACRRKEGQQQLTP